MRIAQRALQRMRLDDGRAAGAGKEHVDRFDAHAYGERGVAPPARLLVDAGELAGFGNAHRFAAIFEHQRLGGIDQGRGFGDADLQGREIGDLPAGRSGDARAHRSRELLDRGLRDAEHGGAVDEAEERVPGELVERAVIGGAAGMRRALAVGRGERAMLGHEDIVGGDVLAAGAGKTHRMPIVDDG